MNFPTALLECVASFLTSTDNEDVLRDLLRRGRTAVGQGSILMRVGPITMRFVLNGTDRINFRLQLHFGAFIPPLSWGMNLRRHITSWVDGPTDEHIVKNCLGGREAGRAFLPQPMLNMPNYYTVDIIPAPGNTLVLPAPVVVPWTFDPRSVTTLRFSVDMTPPPLWNYVTVRQALPLVARGLIMRFIEYRSLDDMMAEVFGAARHMAPGSRKLHFAIEWSRGNVLIHVGLRIHADVEYVPAGGVRVRICYSRVGFFDEFRVLYVYAHRTRVDFVTDAIPCVDERILTTHGFRDVDFHHLFCTIFHPRGVALRLTVRLGRCLCVCDQIQRMQFKSLMEVSRALDVRIERPSRQLAREPTDVEFRENHETILDILMEERDIQRLM